MNTDTLRKLILDIFEKKNRKRIGNVLNKTRFYKIKFDGKHL